MGESRLRLLFASIHSYLDPSSGAAIATRDMMELLAARGHDCRVLCAGLLDFQSETSVDRHLEEWAVPVRRARALLGDGLAVEVRDLTLGGVRITLMPTASSRMGISPDRAEGEALLRLADQTFARFRPDALLTYGGHPVSLELMRRARGAGIPVVFAIHNLSYTRADHFAGVSATVVPSHFSRDYYETRLGLRSQVIPNLIRFNRVVAPERDPRYLTFINPQPGKGVTVFARIASELGRRRPDIPLLVVEGRGKVDWLARLPLDLSGLANLHRMENTPDPRHFYRVTRVLLMPSLCSETFGRVAVEAAANGIPVLASDRGALPETVGGAGQTYCIPARRTPASGLIPEAEEVTDWIRAVERLWDDPHFEADQRARALESVKRWDPEALLDRYESLIHAIQRT